MDLVSVDVVLTQMESAMECPCCLNKPKPGETIVGMCLSGHMTCLECGEKVLQRSSLCPVCRQDNFQIVRGHKLATAMLQILTSFMVYTCKYPTCGQQIGGSDLIRHEERCLLKPVCCPRRLSCSFKAPVYQFLDGLHARCVSLSNFNEQNQSWNIALDMSIIYSFDVSDISISNRFKPIILKGTLGNFVSHAYVNIVKLVGMAVIYIGWLNKKTHVDERYQKTKFSLFVYANTCHGKVGQFIKKKPVFENEPHDKLEDAIFLSKSILYTWANWSQHYKCHECHLKKGYPHIHVEIKKEQD